MDSSSLVSSSAGELAVTWKDCGVSADAKVTEVTPDTIVLGGTTNFAGSGELTAKDITGGTYEMSMSGVGGIALLGNCKGDASTSATCNIGVGPVKIGTAKFGGVSFPVKKGDVALPNLVAVTLPTGLPSFALSTTTTLKVNDQDGAQALCVQIMTKPKSADTVDSINDSPKPLTMHQEDAEDHKCFEASANSAFKVKGITFAGPCPSKYSTIDHTTTVHQCPDGVTNPRYCQGSVVDVTIKTKGEAGVAQVRQGAPPIVVSFVHPTEPHCEELKVKDPSHNMWWGSWQADKFRKWTSGNCPQKFNYVNEEDAVASGVTHRTLGIKTTPGYAGYPIRNQ